MLFNDVIVWWQKCILWWIQYDETMLQYTSGSGNGNHSVSLTLILIKNKVGQTLPSSYISSMLVYFSILHLISYLNDFTALYLA